MKWYRWPAGLDIHVELVLFRIGRLPDFAPAVALVFLLDCSGGFVLWWMIGAVHLVLVAVMMEIAVIAFHQMTWNILRRCMAQW